MHRKPSDITDACECPCTIGHVFSVAFICRVRNVRCRSEGGLYVPYRGTASALTDLLGGQVQVIFDGAAGFEPLHIRIGICQDSQPGGRDSNFRISN